MEPTLYLINDDEPGQFTARQLTIIRDDVRVGDQPGIVVSIAPPLDRAAGGVLGSALLVPRHRDTRIGDLRNRVLSKPLSVFVCRFTGHARDLKRDLTPGDVSVVFWGLVNVSPDFGQ